MDRIPHLPDEILTPILRYAVDGADTVETPRLAIITLNIVNAGATLSRIVENGQYLLDSDPLRGLLEASYLTREVTLGTFSREEPVTNDAPTWPLSHSGLSLVQTTLLHPARNPDWALDILGLNMFHLRPHRDILFLRSDLPVDMPSNYSTAIGLINGQSFPNIMLEASSFDRGAAGLRSRDDPFAHSRSILSGPSQVYNDLHVAGCPAIFQAFINTYVDMPQNLYFFIGRRPISCGHPSHPGCSIHYDQLEIVPDDGVDEWYGRADDPNLNARERAALAAVRKVRAFWPQWQKHLDEGRLHIRRLPNLFFARVRRDDRIDRIHERQRRSQLATGAGLSASRNGAGVSAERARFIQAARNLFGNSGSFGGNQQPGDKVFSDGEISSFGEAQPGRETQDGDGADDTIIPTSLLVDDQSPKAASDSVHDSTGNVGPAGEDQAGQEIQSTGNPKPDEPQSSDDWFNTVYIPELIAQYVEKWKARREGELWDGRVFNDVDLTTPGPPGYDREAVRQWLTAELRPLFDQELRIALSEQA